MVVDGLDMSVFWATRARLFVVSYVPLIAIFAARSAPHWWWTVALSVLAVAGAFDGWWLVRGARKRSNATMKVTKVEDQGSAVSGYLATYLLPFLTELPAGWGDGLSYFLYFGTAFVIYVRSDLAVVNPTLYLLGWRIYRAGLNDRDTLLVTRIPVSVGQKVRVASALGVHVVVTSSGTIEG
ncbi:hypothetical protein ACQP2K_01470 [Microbispora siamensis]